jgi:multiple sugar transport system ATP-binding protein
LAGITIEDVSKKFGSTTALERLDLTVANGEFVALLGPSGCGKTTLLRILAGLETRSSGKILIGDKDVSDLPPAQRGLAMVFQNYAVFPHLTVYENVAFGLRMQKRDDTIIKRQVQRAADLLHIGPYLDRYPAKLSGGQRQRVAVARALAVEPSVLLMDEPLSNLDALLRLEMRAELKSVLKEAGTTTLYVTHDQTEAMGLADRIAVMYKGVIEQIDTPTRIYSFPSSLFVGGFVGSPPINFLKVTAHDHLIHLGNLIFSSPRNGSLLLGFRGEDVTLVPAADGLPFTIKVVEPMGSHLLLTGQSQGERLRIVAPPDAELPTGIELGLKINLERIVLLDPTTEKRL